LCGGGLGVWCGRGVWGLWWLGVSALVVLALWPGVVGGVGHRALWMWGMSVGIFGVAIGSYWGISLALILAQ